MAERTVPWWRKALNYALDGIRSGFGLFLRAAKPAATEPLDETEEPSEEERLLPQKPTIPEPLAVTAVAVPEPAPVAEAIPAAPIPEVAVVVEAIESVQTISPSSVAPASIAPTVDLPAASAELAVAPASDPVLPPAPEQPAMIAAEPIVEQFPDPRIDPAVVESVEIIAPDVEAGVEVEAAPETQSVDSVVDQPSSPTVEAEPVSASTSEAATPPQPAEEPIAATVPEPERGSIAEELPATEEPEESNLPVEQRIEPVAEAVPVVELALEHESRHTEELSSEPVAEPLPEPPLATKVEATAEPQSEPPAEAAVPIFAAPVIDEKAAARLAARQKKLNEADEQSPFSVIVDNVYDGPLDLLLDLIRKQDIDIYDIPIAKITSQFLAYVNQLKASDVDVAGEFIYIASLLIHIKSKMLLPRAPAGPEDTPEDPRRELVERLLEHERFKNAAQMLQQKQLLEAASWTNPGAGEFKDDESVEPEIAADTVDLVRIFRDILERARTRPVIDVSEDQVTVAQMIQFLARRLTMEDKPVALRRLLAHTRSERALIAMFLALLELVRLQAILLRQDRAFCEIFIKKHTGFDAVMNEGLVNARDDWK